MQARTRRNRVAILVAMALCFTSTCAIQSDRDAMLRSGAANTAFAATTGGFEIETDVQAVLGPADSRSSLQSGADAYEVADLRKADLYEYDDSLMLVRYEAVESEPDETPTTTTATTTAVTADSETNITTVTSAVTTYEEPVVTARETIAAEPGSVVFYSSGFGHGVGMSQYGANNLAKRGYNGYQILRYFYANTKFARLKS